jgi:hypothetical protein
MKVEEIIQLLKTYPQDAAVYCPTSTCCGCALKEIDVSTITYDKENNTVDIDSPED